MPQRNKPSALHADDFDLLSTGDQIILQARGGQTEFFARDDEGNELTVANLEGEIGVGIEEDGVTLLQLATALDFTGSGVDVVDDGDGTVTVTNTNTQAWPFAQTSVPGEDAATWRWHVPADETWVLVSCGLQDPTQAVPAGTALEVYNETAAAVVHTSTAVYEEPADVTVAGPADLRIQLQNNNAAGSGELLIGGQLDYELV